MNVVTMGQVTDAPGLLRDAGTLDITRATESYSLEKPVWFQQGAEFYYQDYPGVIEAEGDTGDSGWVNGYWHVNSFAL
tara:strand:- start:1173 stop:1406 length:234 start_codon:yes stop_codon:yes gene_type:complete